MKNVKWSFVLLLIVMAVVSGVSLSCSSDEYDEPMGLKTMARREAEGSPEIYVEHLCCKLKKGSKRVSEEGVGFSYVIRWDEVTTDNENFGRPRITDLAYSGSDSIVDYAIEGMTDWVVRKDYNSALVQSMIKFNRIEKHKDGCLEYYKKVPDNFSISQTVEVEIDTFYVRYPM